MTINGIELTIETIIATRYHFADIDQACIISAIKGEFKVNDLTRYIKYHNQSITKTLKGEYDHTLAFLQQALFIQTGQMVAILS